jgi:hypothetical protein
MSASISAAAIGGSLPRMLLTRALPCAGGIYCCVQDLYVDGKVRYKWRQFGNCRAYLVLVDASSMPLSAAASV